MIKKKKKYSIISINPYNNTFCKSFDSKIKSIYSVKYSRKIFYTSFIYSKRVITTKVSISRNISQEDISNALEIKAYEELGLDQSIEYKFSFLEIPTLPTEKERKFHVFILDPAEIEKDFSKIKNKVSYFDTIYPVPILFLSVYKLNLLESEGNHIFIYFQEGDTFLALYRDGNYFYSKSLNYSLDYIYEKFCEYKGERIERSEFSQILSQEGLKTTNLEYQQYFMKIFSEIFMHINDVLIFIKRTFEIERLDKVFISSEIGYIIGVEEYSQTYLGISSFEYGFNYQLETKDIFIEDIHYLMHLCAALELEKQEFFPNLTIYPKPAPLYSRPTGKLLMAFGISVILSLIYPSYNFFYGKYLEKKFNKLKERYYNKIHPQKLKLETQLNKLKKQKKEILKKFEKENKIFTTRAKILENIYHRKIDNPMKAKILSKISNKLVKYNLKTTKIKNEENLFLLHHRYLHD